MEFLDPGYKKKHARLLFVGYALLSVLIAFLASLFVLEARGFYVGTDGEIVQNSLLFVDSHPADALIYVDGVLESSRTDARLVLPEGRHFVEVQKSGYDIWQKEITLVGGKVSFAKYPFLYPANPVEETIASYEESPVVTQTPDRRWLLVQSVASPLVASIYDLDDDQLAVREIDLSDLSQDEDVSIEIVEWSTDSRRALVRLDQPVDSGGQSAEYWLVDVRGSDEPVQLELNDDKQVKSIQLVDGKVEQVYVHYDDLQLEKYDLQTRTSAVVAVSASAFAAHDDRLVLYAQRDNATGTHKLIISDLLQEYALTDLTSQEPGDILLDIARFDGAWYYVIGAQNEDRLRVYEDPLESIKSGDTPKLASNLAVTGLKSIAFSTNTRFVSGIHDQGVVIYDAENEVPYRYGADSDTEFRWMDGHRLFTSVDGILTIRDFDGLNARQLGAVSSEENVFFDKSYDAVYSLRDSVEGSGVELVSTALITPADQ